MLLTVAVLLAAIFPALVLLIPFYLKRNKTLSQQKPFHEVYLAYLAYGPLCCSVLLAWLIGGRIYPLWGIPFFMWVGVYWMVKWQSVYHYETFRNFVIAAFILGLLMVMGRTLDLEFGPAWNGHASYQNYPAKHLANMAEQLWQQSQSGPMPAVMATQHEAQSVVVYSRAPHPIPFISWEGVENTWVKETKIKETGAVIILPVEALNNQDFSADFRLRFPTLGPVHRYVIPYETHYKVNPLRVIMAVLPPRTL